MQVCKSVKIASLENKNHGRQYSTCNFFAAPSAPPDTVYVTEIYSDSIGLSWSTLPPEHHNGEIIGYNITVTAIYSGETFTIFSETNSTIVSSLVSFTSYSYSVAAVTIAGVGPYSSVSTVLTGEAGMYIHLICLLPLVRSMYMYYHSSCQSTGAAQCN
jgi:hypothetical protein